MTVQTTRPARDRSTEKVRQGGPAVPGFAHAVGPGRHLHTALLTMLTGALAIAAAAVAVGVVVYVVNTLTYAGSTNTTPDCQLVGFPTNVDRCQNEGSPSTHR